MVIQAYQMSRLPNYCLSLSHDFSTHMTSAFLTCTHMFEASSGTTADMGSPRDQIRKLFDICPHLWTDPLFLPSIVISNYSRQVQRHTSLRHAEVVAIGNHLGVSMNDKLRHVDHGLIDQFDQKADGDYNQTHFRQIKPSFNQRCLL